MALSKEYADKDFKKVTSDNPIWEYFLRHKNGEVAKCMTCPNSNLKIKGGSTGPMRNHMRLKHKTTVDLKQKNSPSLKSNVPTTEQLITNCFKKEKSLARVISELAALHHLPFSTISSCNVIRSGLTALGYDAPKDPHIVKKLVMEYFEEVKEIIKTRIKLCKEKDHRFAVTLDEWTDIKNKRSLNVNVHMGAEPINLGLVSVGGSCPAEKAKELVEQRLNEYTLTVQNHIIGETTDGASVMEKYGRMIECLHFMCYAHAYHLSITDVLYSKAVTDDQNNEDPDSEDEIEEDETTCEDFKAILQKVSHYFMYLCLKCLNLVMHSFHMVLDLVGMLCSISAMRTLMLEIQ